MEPDTRCLVGLSFVRLIFGLKVQFSSTQQPSHLTLCLYEKWLTRRNVVIGTQEIHQQTLEILVETVETVGIVDIIVI